VDVVDSDVDVVVTVDVVGAVAPVVVAARMRRRSGSL